MCFVAYEVKNVRTSEAHDPSLITGGSNTKGTQRDKETRKNGVEEKEEKEEKRKDYVMSEEMFVEMRKNG